MSNLLFTNIMDFEALENKKYEEPPSLSNFEEKAQIVMEEYDKTHDTKLNIVLFK